MSDLTVTVQLNAPDEGDDPENRYDCDICASAPEADEYIVLVLDDGDVVAKFCLEHAAGKLCSVPRANRDHVELAREAMAFDLSGEYPTTFGPSATDLSSVRAYSIDDVFDGDVRNLLIACAGTPSAYAAAEDLEAELARAETDRKLDLRRVYEILCRLPRDEVSELAMAYSLCPLHLCDWAICFDDEDPECWAIRHAFPTGHDT